jgi:hypothetical protein
VNTTSRPDEKRDDSQRPEDYLSESRMYVVLANGGAARRAFGPYRAVQITADAIWVSEGCGPFRIARKEACGRWEVPDGSDQPESFRHVLVLCPPAGVGAAQVEERLGPPSRG